MSSPRRTIVIGGGFYGCCIAIFFRRAGDDVVLLEGQPELLTRASYNNQARVHGGYHYPRSILTGKSCVTSCPLFVEVFPESVTKGFTKLYGIARVNSRVTAAQFAGFCRRVGAPIQEAPAWARALVNRDLIEEVFQVQEYAFDAARLRTTMQLKLDAEGVQTQLNCNVKSIAPASTSGELRVKLQRGETLEANQVFNCTFANINRLLQESGLPILDFRHELAEICLIRPPAAIAKVGMTVMDGPFFSAMPFPAEKLHSFTHVRYTPHLSWNAAEQLPAADLDPNGLPKSRYTQMLKDTVRYMPVMEQSEYVRSLFEVKTTLGASERNDGRPILFKRDYGFPGLHVVMGGKIDNIFDILRGLSDMRGKANDSSQPADDAAIDADYFRRLFHVDCSRVG
jgi:glycine/D-amino acid oxidase-like deaminating enzyme